MTDATTPEQPRQVTLHMFEPGGYESPEFCRHCGEREDYRTHVAPLRYHNAGSLLHELATAASIMLDSPEYQSANERRLTRSVQNARSFLAGEDMPILAIEAEAAAAPGLNDAPETESVRRCVTHHACDCHMRLAEIGRRYLAALAAHSTSGQGGEE